MESVISVQVIDEYHLLLQFSTGEKGMFDVRPLLDKGVFKRLRDQTLFKQAHVCAGTVCWPGNLDIAPETLYDRAEKLPAVSAKPPLSE